MEAVLESGKLPGLATFIGVFTGSVTNTFGERLPLTFSIVRLSSGAGLVAGLLAGMVTRGFSTLRPDQSCSSNICNFNK